MQLFPHEVADVQPVLDLLFRQDPKDTEVRLAFLFLFVYFLQRFHFCYLWCQLHQTFTNSVYCHLIIPDLGNSLHAVAVAVHDLPHTLWPFSSGWTSGVWFWQGQRVYHGPHSSYCKGNISIRYNLDAMFQCFVEEIDLNVFVVNPTYWVCKLCYHLVWITVFLLVFFAVLSSCQW